MKTTTQNDQRTVIAKAEDLLTHPPTERTGEREIGDATSPQTNLARQQKMAHHPVKRPEEKRKKHRILFVVTLASLLLFPSIFIFTLPAFAEDYHTMYTMVSDSSHENHIASIADESVGCALRRVFTLGLSKCKEKRAAPWNFPCSDNNNGDINASVIKDDWLSGDPKGGGPTPQGGAAQPESGHFFLTFSSDSYNLPGMQKLSPIMAGAGFALLSPIIVLIGYQVLWASWTFSYARILNLFPQLLLSIIAMAASHTLIQMLIDLTNGVNQGLLALHAINSFPPITINGDNVLLTLKGDDSNSLRGIVMPVSRWGCAINDFIGILEQKFLVDVLGVAVPLVGGLVKLAGTIIDAIDLLKMLGTLMLCVMSIGLCVQVVFRIILLNYYILISPMIFACWALPGGIGQGLVSQWFKGFFSLLFVQTFQVFVAVTLPLILPPFPQVPWDGTGLLKTLILQLPPVIVLAAINKVPTFLGTKATAAVAQAGSVTSGAVVALAATAYQIV